MKALITGITGQDGSYLAELLLEKGYEIHGVVRPTSSKLNQIEHLSHHERVTLHHGDMCDSESLQRVIDTVQPDEIYNLAALSHIQDSYDLPEKTTDVAALGTLRILEAIRIYFPSARLFQALSSELFGQSQEAPQTENTPFAPRSIYGAAKLYAYWTVVHYRNFHKLFTCNGILFNHESPRRSETFVSRKIIAGIVRILAGLQDRLVLGNLDAVRDWGYAKDFVEGMWRMLQLEAPEDFILATGQTTTVRRFAELAFREVGIKISWEGQGINEKGIDSATGKIVIEISPLFFRPNETNVLVGDSTKAKQKLGWTNQTTLEKLVQIMVNAELQQMESYQRPPL